MGAIWIRRNGGDWNANPSANPSTGVGGVAIPAFFTGGLIYATMNGDVATMTCNMGATPFTYSVPAGFTAGWPAIGGGFTTLDPSKLYGNASLSNGNLTGSFDPSEGQALSIDGYLNGSIYFEWSLDSTDIFTHTFGMGITQNNSELPSDDWQWGAGQSWHDIWVLNNQTVGIFPTVNTGDIFSVAVIFETDGIIGVEADFGIGQVSVLTNITPAFEMDLLLCQQFVIPVNDRDLTLRYSDDAGASWSSGITQSIGLTGEYLTNIQFLRLGMARNRIFELTWSGPMETALTGVFIDFDILGT